MLRTISRYTLSAFFIVAGVNHFIRPELYLSMMPHYLPAHELLNIISGAAEIAGGLGVLLPWLRRAAGCGLILLLIAIFPANIHMALHGMAGADIAPWILWLRLPFQLVLIAWVVYASLSKNPNGT